MGYPSCWAMSKAADWFRHAGKKMKKGFTIVGEAIVKSGKKPKGPNEGGLPAEEELLDEPPIE